jgi:hypothetical protein
MFKNIATCISHSFSFYFLSFNPNGGVSFAKFHLFVPGYSAEFGLAIAAGALKAKNRRPTSGGRLVVPTGELSLPALASHIRGFTLERLLGDCNSLRIFLRYGPVRRTKEEYLKAIPKMWAPDDKMTGSSLVGAVLARRYKILETIDADAFKAHDLALVQTVMVRQVSLTSQRASDTWCQKVHQLALVRNSNFLNVLDVISDKSNDFVITERPKGRSIADVLRPTRLKVFGLFSNNVGPFSSNVVLGGRLFSINLVPEQRMFLGQAIYVLGPLQVWTQTVGVSSAMRFTGKSTRPVRMASK